MGSMDNIRGVEKRELQMMHEKRFKFVQENMVGDFDIEEVARKAQLYNVYDTKLKLPMVVSLLKDFCRKHF